MLGSARADKAKCAKMIINMQRKEQFIGRHFWNKVYGLIGSNTHAFMYIRSTCEEPD